MTHPCNSEEDGSTVDIDQIRWKNIVIIGALAARRGNTYASEWRSIEPYGSYWDLMN